MFRRRLLARAVAALMACWILCSTTRGDAPSRPEATAAMHRAVDFFRRHAASDGGGYVYRLSADLQRREGEGAVERSTAWIQPPGTPFVGMAYLEAYRLTGDPRLKRAAVETADALVCGQLESGGWDNRIEFAAEQRSKYAYRVQPHQGSRNTTTLDDDKSQSAARFLMELDQTLEFQNARLHEAVTYALDSFLKAQYANGAWPQRYDDFPDPAAHQPRTARFPNHWQREFPGRDYKGFYTLNDNTMSDMIETMLRAEQIYGDPRYLDAAKRAGDFLIAAQLPEPQPGWAQQYDDQMQPSWARKFEPPAVTGGESQGVMRSLLRLYHATGEEKYLAPIPRAIAYYRSLELPNGQLARFYEMGTDRPLYFTKDYRLTYSDAELPTHYGFKVSSTLEAIEREYKRMAERPQQAGRTGGADGPAQHPRLTESLTRRAEAVIAALDERGAWVEPGRLRYHGDDDPAREIIDSRTFATNLRTLAQYLAASEAQSP